LNKSQNN